MKSTINLSALNEYNDYLCSQIQPLDDMKKTLTVLLCAALSVLTSFAQRPIPAHFDECVELMATVWRLSGAEEYNRCRVPQYAHEVDSVFGPYKDHPVVQLARQYQNESGISYDAVASYGLHLTLNANGAIVLDDSFLEGSDNSFDRWSEQQKKEFLEPLNDFYRKSLFHDWYLQQDILFPKQSTVSSSSLRQMYSTSDLQLMRSI